MYIHTYISSKHPADVIRTSTRDKESYFTVAEGNDCNRLLPTKSHLITCRTSGTAVYYMYQLALYVHVRIMYGVLIWFLRLMRGQTGTCHVVK